MKAAKPNNYGITHAGYATSMTGNGDDLRTQLKSKAIEYRETSLPMGTLFAEPASIISYTNPVHNRQVSVLIIPVGGIPDDWCEEYYSMVGTDHESALSRNWAEIVDDVRKLYNP